MENKRFFTATDVQEMLGVSLSYDTLGGLKVLENRALASFLK